MGEIVGTVRLETKTHREIWRRRSGAVLKDFEWTLTPTLYGRGENVAVIAVESLKKHADEFAGIAGELRFSVGESRKSIEVTFTDDTSVNDEGRSPTFPNKPIMSLKTHHVAVDRTWAIEWQIVKPEEWENKRLACLALLELYEDKLAINKESWHIAANNLVFCI